MYLKYIFLFSLFIGCSWAGNASAFKYNFVKVEHNVSDPVDNGTHAILEVASSTTPVIVPDLTNASSSTTTPSSSTSTPSSTPPSTTIPPSSTTTPPSTPVPTPTPHSDVWTVTNSTSNITCIVAKMDIVMEIHHENKIETLKGNPNSAHAKGVCGKDIQTLEIFLSENETDSAHLSFNFSETEKMYFVSSLEVKILLNDFTVDIPKNLTVYETGKNTSYSCESYTINFELNSTSIKLDMSTIQIEAFRLTNSSKFSSANHCSNGDVPDIVPLIVGLALAGLVVAVVIGYFIGRKRSQARGYLSM